jgi:hypothetical protein
MRLVVMPVGERLAVSERPSGVAFAAGAPVGVGPALVGIADEPDAQAAASVIATRASGRIRISGGGSGAPMLEAGLEPHELTLGILVLEASNVEHPDVTGPLSAVQPQMTETRQGPGAH